MLETTDAPSPSATQPDPPFHGLRGGGVLVLGGSGFIGDHLLRALMAAGADPVVSLDLVRPSRPVPGVRYVDGDVRRPLGPALDVAEALGSFRALFNLAAVHVTPGHPDHAYYDTNVLGAIHACRLAAERGINRVVFTSSISTYGPREEPCDETATLRPVSAYGRSKRMAELIHEDWQAADAGRRLAIARPAVVFGPGERGNVTRLIRALRRRFFVFPGRRDTIKGCGYVLDLVRSFDFALQRDEPVFLYNFALPTPVSIERICAAVKASWGGGRPLGVMPAGLLRGVATLFELAERVGVRSGINRARIEKLMLSTDVRPVALQRAGFRFRYGLTDALGDWRAQDPGLDWRDGR